mmetsp:Transcript_32802/g.87007  ORF Transcript_32802/g.87007 Transcript_32802/m.87007 type:complete len:109 (+) Transcript_32802:433-759(+)
MVVGADTVVHKRAVMIHPSNTSIACTAVMRSIFFHTIAFGTYVGRNIVIEYGILWNVSRISIICKQQTANQRSMQDLMKTREKNGEDSVGRIQTRKDYNPMNTECPHT